MENTSVTNIGDCIPEVPILQETAAAAYNRGRVGPLLWQVGEVLYRPLGKTGCELVLGLDRLPSRESLSRLAGRMDLALLIEQAAASIE